MYAVSDLIGSPGEMYDRMVKYAEVVPVSGNRGGSYLTMWSLQGIKFGILQVSPAKKPMKPTQAHCCL